MRGGFRGIQKNKYDVHKKMIKSEEVGEEPLSISAPSDSDSREANRAKRFPRSENQKKQRH